MLDPVINLGKFTVSTGYGSSDTSIILTSGGSTLPTSGSFNMIWWNATDYPDPCDDPNAEIVRVNGPAISGNTLPITRAQEGTSASTKNGAGKVYKIALAMTAKMITDIQTAINNVLVGYRTGVATFTTAGGDTSFTISAPGGATVTAITNMNIASQQYVPGVDVILSGNNAQISAYPLANEPVIILYTY